MTTGLVEDKEVEDMQQLVEHKLKKLHFNPPRGHDLHLDLLLASHPLLSAIPLSAFRTEVDSCLLQSIHCCSLKRLEALVLKIQCSCC